MKTKSKMFLLSIAIIALFTVLGCTSAVKEQDNNPATETVSPTVLSTFPTDKSTEVALNTAITVTFSESMDSASFIPANFTLKAGDTEVTGLVTYNLTTNTAIFTPENSLAANSVYTATVSIGVKDLAGNALSLDMIWSFTTSAAADTTAPAVLAVFPIASSSDVAINTLITATFTEPMNQATIIAANFTVKAGTTAVTGGVTYDSVNKEAIFTPTANLASSTVYTVTVTTDAKDLAGNGVGVNKVWTFTTSAVADTTAPSTLSAFPLVSSTDAAINTLITATFAEPMNSATINAESFMVKAGTTVVAGSVTYDSVNKEATFTPTANLGSSTLYTVTLTTDIKDLAGNGLAVNKVWSFTTSAVADTTAPAVLSVFPVASSTNAAINTLITATFNEPMNSATIIAANFTVKAGTTAVAGSVTYDSVNKEAIFTPTANLASSTLYTATVTTGAKDLAGNGLAINKVWTFTTSAAADTTAPAVLSVFPVASSTNVAINTLITATFNEPMSSATIIAANFTVKAGTTAVTGSVTYDSVNKVTTFTPTANLASSTVYTATVTTGAKDLAGNGLAVNKVWTFTTSVAADTTAPGVLSVFPVDSSTNVAINTLVTATFNEPMNSATIIATNFTVKAGTTAVTGSVTYDSVNKVATFTPASNLASSTVYTATVTTGAKDLAGNGLAINKVWTFTTSVAADTTAPGVLSVFPVDSSTNVAINTLVTATFTEPMNSATIIAANFTVKAGATTVDGSVTYDSVNKVATFTPSANLASSTVYTATVTTGAKDLAGNGLVVNKVWTFTTSAAADTTAPAVLSVFPVDSSTNVAINTLVTATFTEPMDSATIIAANFTVKAGATTVDGSVTYDSVNKVATFTPSANLASSTLYTATVTTGAKDLAGNGLVVNKVWTFTTSTTADTTAPSVLSVFPVASSTDVAINTLITATFNEAMDSATIIAANFTVKAGTAAVDGSVTYDSVNKVATFTPSANLASNTLYTATVTTGAKDLAGNGLAVNKVWNFTTSATADTIPASGTTGVSVGSNITATFSKDMDYMTINGTTFKIMNGATPVTGNVSYDTASKKAIFSLMSSLDSNTTYTVIITTGVQDIDGNPLLVEKTWDFTTAALAAGPLPVILGAAGNFVVLAKSAVSTVPTSVIKGNVGLSPAAETFITGFSQTDATGYATSPQVTEGYIYASTMAPPTPSNMTQAISDMEAAYTDAATRPIPDATNLGAGSLGGLTLTPGLYKWTTDVIIPTDVTISGGGGSDDVWIFQIAGNLTQSSAINVILTNGAQAKNIYWQVAGQVFLGTTSHFEGTILCMTSITLATNASLYGRVLAQTMVALDQNTVTIPTP